LQTTKNVDAGPSAQRRAADRELCTAGATNAKKCRLQTTKNVDADSPARRRTADREQGTAGATNAKKCRRRSVGAAAGSGRGTGRRGYLPIAAETATIARITVGVVSPCFRNVWQRRARVVCLQAIT